MHKKSIKHGEVTQASQYVRKTSLLTEHKGQSYTVSPFVKGIVHPKMKILSSFTHPQVVPNLYEFLVLPNTKEDILKKVCNQAVLGHHWLHSRKKIYTMQVVCPRTALFPTFFRISSFVFSRTKTFIQVWNYLRVSKWWQNFHFWVNYPFKVYQIGVPDTWGLA